MTSSKTLPQALCCAFSTRWSLSPGVGVGVGAQDRGLGHIPTHPGAQGAPSPGGRSLFPVWVTHPGMGVACSPRRHLQKRGGLARSWPRPLCPGDPDRLGQGPRPRSKQEQSGRGCHPGALHHTDGSPGLVDEADSQVGERWGLSGANAWPSFQPPLPLPRTHPLSRRGSGSTAWSVPLLLLHRPPRRPWDHLLQAHPAVLLSNRDAVLGPRPQSHLSGSTTVCRECPGCPLHLGWGLLDPHLPHPCPLCCPSWLDLPNETNRSTTRCLGVTGGARTSPQDRWTPRGQDTQRGVRYWPLESVMPPRRPICPLSTFKIHAFHRVHSPPPHPPGERSTAF